MKKYEFTGETKEVGGRVLHRIRALRDFCCVQVNGNNWVINNFYGVQAGDFGGWIEREENLAHEDDCWVGPYACVYDWARVFGNALVYDEAHVHGNTLIYEDAVISGDSDVSGYSQIYGNARISGNTQVSGFIYISGNVELTGFSYVNGNINLE